MVKDVVIFELTYHALLKCVFNRVWVTSAKTCFWYTSLFTTQNGGCKNICLNLLILQLEWVMHWLKLSKKYLANRYMLIYSHGFSLYSGLKPWLFSCGYRLSDLWNRILIEHKVPATLTRYLYIVLTGSLRHFRCHHLVGTVFWWAHFLQALNATCPFIKNICSKFKQPVVMYSCEHIYSTIYLAYLIYIRIKEYSTEQVSSIHLHIRLKIIAKIRQEESARSLQ